jgi:hypothetical protein
MMSANDLEQCLADRIAAAYLPQQQHDHENSATPPGNDPGRL